MTDTVQRLVYYSRNRMVGTQAEIDDAIRTILHASRHNNAAVGVTGALMFNSGCFAQVLEGSPAAVQNTFERIQQDERHGEVSLLSFGPAPNRCFEVWSMAYIGNAADDNRRYGAIATESGFDPSRMGGESLFEFIRRMLIEEEKAA